MTYNLLSSNQRGRAVLKRGLFLFLSLISVTAAFGQRMLPFQQSENVDDSKYVWFMYNQEGMSYNYCTAAKFPPPNRFNLVKGNKREVGDMAVWKKYMAIYNTDLPNGANVITVDGPQRFEDLSKKYGPVKWYRYHTNAPKTDTYKLFDVPVQFTIPDASLWTRSKEETKVSALKDRGILLYQREALIDTAGLEVKPVLSIIYAKIPKDMTEAQFIEQSRKARDYEFRRTDVSLGEPLYYYHYKDKVLEHDIIVRYIVSNGLGIIVLTNSTKEIFPFVEKDFRTFVSSVKIVQPQAAAPKPKKKS